MVGGLVTKRERTLVGITLRNMQRKESYSLDVHSNYIYSERGLKLERIDLDNYEKQGPFDVIITKFTDEIVKVNDPHAEVVKEKMKVSIMQLHS